MLAQIRFVSISLHVLWAFGRNISIDRAKQQSIIIIMPNLVWFPPLDLPICRIETIYNRAPVYAELSKLTVSGHYRPTSKTPFEWRFAGGPMMARFYMLTWNWFFCSVCWCRLLAGGLCIRLWLREQFYWLHVLCPCWYARLSLRPLVLPVYVRRSGINYCLRGRRREVWFCRLYDIQYSYNRSVWKIVSPGKQIELFAC